MAKTRATVQVRPTPDTLTLGWARRIVKKTMGPRARVWDNGNGTYSLGIDKQPGRHVMYTDDNVWRLLFGATEAPRPVCPTCGGDLLPLSATVPDTGETIRGEGCIKCQTFDAEVAPAAPAEGPAAESALEGPRNDATPDPVGRPGNDEIVAHKPAQDVAPK